MTTGEFYKIILSICNRNTSLDPCNWSENNPTYGHCAIVSVLAQELLGGIILRKSYIENGVEHSHYLNKLEDGQEIDFTVDQFQNKMPNFNKIEERTKEKILSNPNTLKRYNLLINRFKDRG